MTHGTRQTQAVLFLGLQRTAVASLLLPLCQATEKTLGGCLLISHHVWAMPSSHLWSSCWRAHLPLSLNCQGALVSAAATSTCTKAKRL